MKHTELLDRVRHLLIHKREEEIYDAVLRGEHVAWPMVDIPVSSPDGKHTGTIFAASDYFSIGTRPISSACRSHR